MGSPIGPVRSRTLPSGLNQTLGTLTSAQNTALTLRRTGITTGLKRMISTTRRGDFRMRGLLLAMLVAAGVGLVASADVSAAPINGAAIGNAAAAASPVEQVQH